MTESQGCPEVRDLLPEFAMGSATGQERAEVLRHLTRCAQCRRELDELSRVADELLLMTPEREPPAGFEAAVLDRMRRSDAIRSRRGARVGRLLLRAAAVVLVAALCAGAVWWWTADDRRIAGQYQRALHVADGSYLTAAPVAVSGREAGYDAAGYVFAYQGNPSWLLLNISSAPAPGRYRVTVVTVDGESRSIGACVVAESSCTLGNTIGVPVFKIQAVRVSQPGVPALLARLR
jgi:hypothetical protein